MQPTASHVLDLSTGPIMVADSFRGKKSNNRKTVKTRKVPLGHPISLNFIRLLRVVITPSVTSESSGR